MALPRRGISSQGISSLRLRLYGLGLLCVVLAVALGVIVYRGLAARRSVAGESVVRAVDNPFGANFFLTREVEPWKLEKTL
ncbi:MAG: hypothetical protein GX557_08845, partial [Chloroflexi bacterium]|nr:hypothetical protein [Chloroflexota bacterium]